MAAKAERYRDPGRVKSCRRECKKAISNLVAALEAGAASPTIAAMVRDREEELESIKYAIAKQELVQEKFDEKKIMYFPSKVPEGDRAGINYMQRIVNTFINSVFVKIESLYATTLMEMMQDHR